jgi:CheY-like chemotaxis protein
MSHTILVADDDPEILKMIQQGLEAEGYRVLTANNGAIATRFALTQRPDLIVLDVAMPMSSGLKVYENLRSNPQSEKIPVIFLTGLPSANVYPTVEQGTRVAHLKKPVDLVDLVSMIQKFLQDYSQH